MPSTRDPFLRSSGETGSPPSPSRAHVHSLRPTTASVTQEPPALRVEPMVTPQPSKALSGLPTRHIADDSHVSSSRSRFDPTDWVLAFQAGVRGVKVRSRPALRRRNRGKAHFKAPASTIQGIRVYCFFKYLSSINFVSGKHVYMR